MKLGQDLSIMLLGIGFVLVIIHGIIWLIVKGIIWMTYELFNVNWYSKFWIVYMGLILAKCIIGTTIKINYKR